MAASASSTRIKQPRFCSRQQGTPLRHALIADDPDRSIAWRAFAFMLAIVTVALFTGCVPERIVWSPDGKVALIATETGLFSTDEAGMISEPIGPVDARILGPITWFPDGKEFLVARTEPVREFSRLEQEFGPEWTQRMKDAAKDVVDRALVHNDDWARFRTGHGLSAGEAKALWIHIRENASDELKAKLGPHWNVITGIEAGISRVDRCNLNASEPTAIWRSLDMPMTLRLSPAADRLAIVQVRHRAWEEVAFPKGLTQGGGTVRTTLTVTSLDGLIPARDVAEDVAFWPLWDADGKSLYYVRGRIPTNYNVSDQVTASLCQMSLENDGEDPQNPPSAEKQLATISFNPFTRLYRLPSGQILFQSNDSGIPARQNNTPSVSLFLFHPGQATEPTRIALGDKTDDVNQAIAFGNFSLNAAGNRVAISTGKGRTGIANLDSGVIEWISTTEPTTGRLKDGNWFTTCPTWRTDDELCFVAAPGSAYATPTRGEVVLWSPNRTAVLSLKWDSAKLGSLLGSP